jgi:hypothetical protein
MAIEITLSEAKLVGSEESWPAENKTLTTLTVIEIIDNLKNKIVAVKVEEINWPITLWEGSNYKVDWTNADVEARLIELYDK